MRNMNRRWITLTKTVRSGYAFLTWQYFSIVSTWAQIWPGNLNIEILCWCEFINVYVFHHIYSTTMVASFAISSLSYWCIVHRRILKQVSKEPTYFSPWHRFHWKQDYRSCSRLQRIHCFRFLHSHLLQSFLHPRMQLSSLPLAQLLYTSSTFQSQCRVPCFLLQTYYLHCANKLTLLLCAWPSRSLPSLSLGWWPPVYMVLNEILNIDTEILKGLSSPS